ncbi:MAG: ankyrin repeat domain-containing protein [Legionella sp.]|nr:ankyrin repeat domain-containing protein [Legionella sp.]
MSRIINSISFQKLLELLTQNHPGIPQIILLPNQLENLSMEGQQTFCRVLEKNTSLKRLDLRGNDIDTAFLSDIKNALVNNNEIVEFLYDEQSHNSNLISELQNLVERNRKRVLMEHFVPKPIESEDLNLDEEELFDYIKQTIENGNASLLYELVRKNLDVLNAVDLYQESLLHIAVMQGQIYCVQVLLQLGFPVKSPLSKRDAPLHTAVKNNDITLTELLLCNGASVNSTTNGFTPLHHVCSVEMAKLLIAYGANPTVTVHPESIAISSHKDTVLHSILEKKAEPDLVRYILSLGVPINAQSKDGSTALHILSLWGSNTPESLRKNINLLIKAGANPLIIDGKGHTPLDLAESSVKNALLWQSVTHDYRQIYEITSVVKEVMRRKGFFGAPPEVVERIAVFAATANSLEPDCCDAIATSFFRN